MRKTLRLPVRLSDGEKLIVALDMSAKQSALEAAMKEHNEGIKDLETSIHTIKVSLSTGTCEREVEVEDRKDAETGKSVCWRLDTNEPVNTRAIDPEERQLLLGDDPGPPPAAVLGDDSTRTEEQNAAGTPEEAEQLRDARIAEEQAKRAFDGLGIGDEVELQTELGWTAHKVEEKFEFNFAAGEQIFDVSKFGVSWRLPLTWDDIKAASAEKERLAEIDRLAAEQAADKPKVLLQNPRKERATEKKLNLVDGEDKPIDVAAETPPTDDHPANADGTDGLVF